jgi:hypothetical protein
MLARLMYLDVLPATVSKCLNPPYSPKSIMVTIPHRTRLERKILTALPTTLTLPCLVSVLLRIMLALLRLPLLYLAFSAHIILKKKSPTPPLKGG